MKKDKHQTEPNVLHSFAHLLGTEVKNRRLEIPEKMGKGYCAGFVFNEYIRMLIFNYELNEDLVLENSDINASLRMILFKFQLKAIPSVLIATSRVNTDALIPIDTNNVAINIEMDADYLNGLFDLSATSPVLQSLLQNTQPLLFEQMIYPSLQKIVDEIMDEVVTESIDETFELFFLRIKAEELICRLLMELVKRNETHLYPLNSQDILTLYKIKEQILAHPETPPVINELAAHANMSPSKLKRLFKQIFGSPIFSYYQAFRMKEAARILKEDKLSVSDVGYQLGFTNLSHFSRVFHEHIGMKPKQYSRS
ncbi:MAG: Regulatory protein PchR [Candidatus Ordinivivax streblomastigis]|uniref:Regulatory protein PchR n=1 Tax=Candidatus Ordinivivax streblomastigis TaxID=2540710 RepID=A0A5M8P4W5_9BACT|nr:MAG: Regulatory protein PchR [Candidatus Ordinivivax streblomastigis]KAA6303356.1 MAG: Regulatory protein PchR [Candidatus Ordinivivax streblomastigis]